ncbi:MAG: hypothetical protein JSU01_24015 [Bacteroidetes bacterium]|nr:hypothetical protein [Bacteroidota bacterium]
MKRIATKWVKPSIGILTAIALTIFAGCQKPPVQIPQSDIIALTLTSDTTHLNADGQRILTVHVQLAQGKTVVDDAKAVTISISPNLGTFVGSSGTNSFQVTADSKGEADCSIMVSLTPGTYYIGASTTYNKITYKSADISVVLNPLAFSDKLTFTADNLNPVADGESVVNLTVMSKDEQNPKTLPLSANIGTFVSSGTATYSLPLDNTGKGTTQFKMSNQVLPHVITAAFPDGTSAIITLNPKPSYPDILVAESNTTKVDTVGTAVTVTAFLEKNDANALVSQATRVSYSAYQLVNGAKTPCGRFTGTAVAVSDAKGTVPAVSFYGDTGDIIKTQLVYVDVTVANSATTTLTKTLQLQVKQ